MPRSTRRYVISGRVQGVGFRHFVRTQGRRMNVAGWVRNLPDGRVEAEATAEEDVLALFESALRSGPPLAAVRDVSTTAALESNPSAPKSDSFEVRP
ncbi:MAG: acylphosphatase [Thermoanaerobaculia bacterium]